MLPQQSEQNASNSDDKSIIDSGIKFEDELSELQSNESKDRSHDDSTVVAKSITDN